jgi:hypothetical protein
MRFLKSGYPYAIVKELSQNDPPQRARSTPPNRRYWLGRVQPTRRDGADRNRTDDLRLARAALSHLSYSPQPKQTADPAPPPMSIAAYRWGGGPR